MKFDFDYRDWYILNSQYEPWECPEFDWDTVNEILQIDGNENREIQSSLDHAIHM